IWPCRLQNFTKKKGNHTVPLFSGAAKRNILDSLIIITKTSLNNVLPTLRQHFYCTQKINVFIRFKEVAIGTPNVAIGHNVFVDILGEYKNRDVRELTRSIDAIQQFKAF